MAEDGDYTAALRGSNSDQWQALKPPSAAPPRYGAAANPGGGASGGGACYRCGDPGHWSRDCPVPAPGNAGRMPPATGNPGNAVASKPCGAGMCAVRTSSTSRNPGRQFLTCPAPQDAKCNFFEWCDAAGATPAKPSFQPQQQQQQNAGGEPELKCTKCTQPCPVFTAKTEKNAGRRFYKCRNEACNFFKWCDEAFAPASSPGAGRGGYGNASSGYGVPGGPYGGSGNSFPAHGGSGVGFSSNPGGGYSGYTGSGYGSEYRGNAPSGPSGYGGGGYGNA